MENFIADVLGKTVFVRVFLNDYLESEKDLTFIELNRFLMTHKIKKVEIEISK